MGPPSMRLPARRYHEHPTSQPPQATPAVPSAAVTDPRQGRASPAVWIRTGRPGSGWLLAEHRQITRTASCHHGLPRSVQNRVIGMRNSNGPPEQRIGRAVAGPRDVGRRRTRRIQPPVWHPQRRAAAGAKNAAHPTPSARPGRGRQQRPAQGAKKSPAIPPPRARSRGGRRRRAAGRRQKRAAPPPAARLAMVLRQPAAAAAADILHPEAK